MMTSRLVALTLLVAVGLTACEKGDRSSSTSTTTPAHDASKPAPSTATDVATPPEAAADAAPAATLARPLFWRVEKDGKTVHVLGTFHLGVDPKRLPPVVWDSLGKARAFAMETNLMDPSLLGALMRSDGKTIDEELGPT